MKQNNFVLLACVAVMALFVGYSLRDDSRALKEARAELERLRQSGGDGRMWTDARQLPKRGKLMPGTPGGNAGGSEPGSELLKAAGVTQEDFEATQALDNERRAGIFILKNERPMFRKLQEYDFKQIAATASQEDSAAYQQIFASFGLEPQVGEELQKHLAKIHRASLEAESAVSQVNDARKKYDQRMRSLLGEEGYASYLQQEMAKPAQHEWANIQNYAAQHGAAMDPSRGAEVVQMLLDASATYGGMGHGPYGEVRQVSANQQDALAQVGAELQHLVDSTAEMQRRLAESSLSEGEQRSVAAYLADKISRKQERLEAIRNPKPPALVNMATRP